MNSAFGLRTVIWAIIALLLSGSTARGGPSNVDVRLEKSSVTAATDGDALLVALFLTNAGLNTAVDVQIARITVRNAPLLKPAALPLRLGDIPAGGRITLQLAFARAGLSPRATRFNLQIRGSSAGAKRAQGFNLRASVALPLPDEGERVALQAEVPLRQVDGATLPPGDTAVDLDDVNMDFDHPVPVGQRIGTLEPNAPAVEIRSQLSRSWPGPDTGVTFVRTGSEQLSAAADRKNGWPPDPSGASVDVPVPPFDVTTPLVFLTGNLYALLSSDGGASFTHIDPTTMFNNIPLDKLPQDLGLCCDMNAVYIPSVDRIVWQMLTAGSLKNKKKPTTGNHFNRLRVAFASPQQVIDSGGKAWWLFDITTKTLGLGTEIFLDYPDIHFTGESLLISVNALGKGGGFMVIRVPLADLQGSAVIHIQATKAPDGINARGGRLVHNSPDAAYWAGHECTSDLRVFEWRDGSNTYSFKNLLINSWTDSLYTDSISLLPPVSSITPDGTNWLDANSFAVRGGAFQSEYSESPGSATRRIVFAWNAPSIGGAFGAPGIPQPHVHIQPVTRTKSSVPGIIGDGIWKAESSFDIWNANFAFHHAHLASNSNGEIGVSVGAGGGGSDAKPLVGFLGDSTLYFVNSSTASLSRYGDYSAIRRQWPDQRLFSVSDYFLVGPPSSLGIFHQYRLFGRPADVGP